MALDSQGALAPSLLASQQQELAAVMLENGPAPQKTPKEPVVPISDEDSGEKPVDSGWNQPSRGTGN
jgi:hypothetical protein